MRALGAWFGFPVGGTFGFAPPTSDYVDVIVGQQPLPAEAQRVLMRVSGGRMEDLVGGVSTCDDYIPLTDLAEARRTSRKPLTEALSARTPRAKDTAANEHVKDSCSLCCLQQSIDGKGVAATASNQQTTPDCSFSSRNAAGPLHCSVAQHNLGCHSDGHGTDAKD